MTAGVAEGVEQRAAAPRAGAIASQHVYVASAFLVLGVLLWLATSIKLVEPAFLGGVAQLSYGRLFPVAGNAVLFGWLAIGLLGATYYTVAREFDGALWGARLASANLVLAAAGIAAGMVAVLLGQNQGSPNLEFPIWADAVVTVALFVGAVVVTGTAGRAGFRSPSPAVWFGVSGTWWMALAFLVANVPGLSGINTALQEEFFVASFVLGGILLTAIGLVYSIAAGTGPRRDGGRLASIGLWSFLFVVGWVAPRFAIHGPGPDWLETIGVVFSMVLFIPIWVVLADLAKARRSGWADLMPLPAVRFLVAGGFFLALLPVVNLAHAFRSSSAVVRFTGWDLAFDLLVLFGVASMWLFAFAYRYLPALPAPGKRSFHLGLTLSGLVIALVALWGSGLQQGFTWIGGSNTGDFVDAGDGFLNSVRPLEAWYVVRVAGFALLTIGQLGFAWNLWRQGPRPAVADGAATLGDDAEPSPEEAGVAPVQIELRRLVRGAVALFVVAAFAVVVIPSFEQEHREATLLGVARALPAGSAEADGRAVYVREGCWYCHTQQVRQTIGDVGLGAVSLPGDYAEAARPLLGTSRIGPDLMHAGSRAPTDSVRWNLAHLEAPRTTVDADARRVWSIMPAYGHLSDADLLALAQYIASLK